MINSLRLQNFRSYKDSPFEFSDEVNIVVGLNASGKTNLLEAILVLATGRSYRARMPQLVRLGKNWARLDATTKTSPRTLKITEAQPEFTIGGKIYKRLPATQNLPVILFEPGHLQLASGEPARRRDWLDELIAAIDPSFKKSLAAYHRSLSQRNALLKRTRGEIGRQMFAWDVRLSELAGTIALARAQIIESLNKNITKPYSHIAGHRQLVAASYQSQFNPSVYSSKMLAKLGASLEMDIARGFTSTGPHREDIIFYLNGQPIVTSGSRGETRSLIIALKILERQFIEQASQTKPILLLDDVFSELDGKRRHALVDYLAGYQTIITTTDADSINQFFTKKHNLITLT